MKHNFMFQLAQLKSDKRVYVRVLNHAFDLLFNLRSWKTKHSLMTQGGSFTQT
jgi:hypothetical protein